MLFTSFEIIWLWLLLVQAEENAGAAGTAEDESSDDVNLEVRNYSLWVC